MVKKLNQIKESSGVATDLQADAFQASKVANKDIQSAYDATFKGIRDQTLSLDDMKTIAESDIKYRASSLGFLRDISYGISQMAAEKMGGLETKKMADATEKLQKGIYQISFKNKDKKEVSVKGGKTESTSVYMKKLMESNFEIAQSMDNLDRLKELSKLRKPTPEQKEELAKLKAGKDLWEKTAKDGKKNIDQNNDILSQLQQAGAINQDMVDLTRLQMTKGDDRKKVLLDIAKRKFPGMTKVTEDMVKSLPNIGAEFAADLKSEGVFKAPTGRGVGTGALAVAQGKGEFNPMEDISKQGLTKPEQVTQAGAVVLHPGEAILPKSNTGIRTSPIMEPEKGAGATPVEKNITINVNATERDLAQKIANEIRGFFYKEHVNNQG
jgi:hypothetical protein